MEKLCFHFFVKLNQFQVCANRSCIKTEISGYYSSKEWFLTFTGRLGLRDPSKAVLVVPIGLPRDPYGIRWRI